MVAAVVVLALVGDARAFDSHWGAGPIECQGGYDAARTRWGVTDAGLEDGSAEHRTLWLRSREVSGLPASLDATIELPVFVADVEVAAGVESVRPLLKDAGRAAVRTTSLAEMTQLPDFSYTLWDWAMGNEVCPPDPEQEPLECHEYFPHIGILNSNHMVPQAERFYRYYHALALERAADCKAVHDLLPADEERQRFLPYVLACEKEALLVEAVGQHFLQDAWSMGHMWERWGGPEVDDFAGNRTLGAAIAAFTGIIHGGKALLGEGFDDPMCAPHPGVGYVDGNGTPGDQLGLGDVFVDSTLLDATGGNPYAGQRRAFFGCAVDGMRTVYAATARAHGPLEAPDATQVDTTRKADQASCWGQRATNQALSIGFGLHVGTTPNQVPLLEVYDLVDADVGPGTDGAFPAGIIAWALSEYHPIDSLPPLDEATAIQFAHDAAEAATLAATHGADPETGLQTTLASSGLPPLVGIAPNSAHARGGAGVPPTGYADPPLPWGLTEPGVEGERRQALALLFADAHVAERCNELTGADIEAYRESVADAVENAPDRLEAACGQCTLMAMPHLRFGVPGNHDDERREALCHFVSAGAGFVYTEEDPNGFTGEEATDVASLRRAAEAWCGCEASFTLIAEEGTFLMIGDFTLGDDAPSINDAGAVAFIGVASVGADAEVWVGDGGETSVLDYTQISGLDGHPALSIGAVGAFVGDTVAFVANAGAPSFENGVFAGTGGPLETLYAGPELPQLFPPSLNASGVTAFVGFDAVLGDVLYTATGGTKQIVHQRFGGCCDPDIDAVAGIADINDGGSVAFFASFQSDGTGACDDFIVRSTGDVPVPIAPGGFLCDDGVFRSLNNNVPYALDATGRVAYVTSLPPPFDSTSQAVLVDSTVVATNDGPFEAFTAVALDATGGLAFLAFLDGGGNGIFRGPDPVADKVVATGDELFGSTVSGVAFQRGGLNAAGEIAFSAGLADGRRVVVRADAPLP
jgi:hypothetical protein